MYPLISQFAVGHVDVSGGVALILFFAALFILGGLVFLIFSPWILLAAGTKRASEHIVQSRHNTVVAQFEPPHGLTPAEIGLIYDMKCGEKEIQATLFDLECRGIVARSPDGKVAITNTTAYAQLLPHEKLAIDTVNGLSTGMQFVSTSGKVYDIDVSSKLVRARFTKAVQDTLNAKGYHLKSYTLTFFLRVVVVAVIVGLLPLATVAMQGTYNGVPYAGWTGHAIGTAVMLMIIAAVFLWPVYMFVGYLVIRTWVAVAGRSWLINKQTRQIWAELEGYRLYLKTVDLDNIQFEASQDPRGKLMETMPYAMVFNLDTKWQARLAALGQAGTIYT